MAQRGGHGVPSKSIQMHADSVIHGRLGAGNHVRIAADENKISELTFHGGDDHIRHQSGIHGLLGAALAPFDELAGAKLYTFAGAQRPLVAVRAGIGNAVIPVLALDRGSQLVLDHPAHRADHLG